MGHVINIKNNLTKEVKKMKSQTMKKHKKLERNISQKFFTTCKLNDNRKSFNKLWSTVKDETLPLVE